MLRFAIHFFAVCALALPAFSADDPFVGTWKFNQEKSDLKGQTETITSLGGNKYRFVYGSAVSFDITADGTDQTSFPGATMAITIQSPETWNLVFKNNGAKTGSAVWTLAPDSKSITTNYESARPDGSQAKIRGKLTRTSGTAGFAGTWEIADVEISSASLMQIAPSGTDGIVVSFPSDRVTMNISFDGKDCPVEGPTVIKGSTISAKRPDPNTIAVIDKLSGKVMDNSDWTVSADGKQLTTTEHDAGVDKPVISVYDRQ